MPKLVRITWPMYWRHNQECNRRSAVHVQVLVSRNELAESLND